LTCATCYSWRPSRNQRKDELSTELVKEALRQMGALGVDEIVFSGGEPLLRPDLGEILRVAKGECSLRVYLLTNGTLVQDKIARTLAPYVDVVCISLDGLTEEENALIRGRGVWSKYSISQDRSEFSFQFLNGVRPLDRFW